MGNWLKNMNFLKRNECWHTFIFFMNDENGTNIRMYLDLAVIDLIIGPIVESRTMKNKMWRIHRRADPKVPNSHKLTLRTLMSEGKAKRIEKKFSNNPLFAKLERAAIIRSFKHDFDSSKTGVKDTSQNDWPLHTQNSWPEFAKGFSMSLIATIRSMRQQAWSTLIEKNAAEIVETYREIDKLIRDEWDKDGAGAFFHQTHAIFGYPEFESDLRFVNYVLGGKNSNMIRGRFNYIHSQSK